MIITEQQANQLFLTLRQHIPNPSLHSALEAIRPVSPDTLEWRYELRGFIGALQASETLSHTPGEEALRILFGKPPEMTERPGRKYTFSIDVFSTLPNGETRRFEFDVAAMNAFDAYVQLTKRMTYRSISEIDYVAVYDGMQHERKAAQTPVKRFENDELIYVNPAPDRSKEAA